MDPIDQFLTNLLHAAKLDALPEQARAEVSLRLRSQVDRRVGLVALANLDDDGVAAYTQLMESGPTPEEMEQFLTARIPDYPEKLHAALDAFAAEYIAAATAPRAS